jgi:PhnB protein
MQSINPYLNFNGNCEEAFEFYKSVLGGEFKNFSRFSEIPSSENFKLDEHEAQKIMHVSLVVSDMFVLMGSDAMKGQTVEFGNNNWLSVQLDSKEEAAKIFAGLSDGGEILMPIADTFWGGYFGMFKDKFGMSWMINSETSFIK